MRRRKKCKTGGIWLRLLLLTLLLAGCGGRETPSEASADAPLRVYYINHEETAIVSVPYELTADADAEPLAAIGELIAQMKSPPAKENLLSPLSGSAVLESYAFSEGLLTLDFGVQYGDLDAVTEILTRAAIVRTLSQPDAVKGVNFLVMGEPLTDASGAIVGNMSADNFIVNTGNEINSYDKVRLTLYFADASGERLVPVYRNVVFKSNLSMERLVVEQLIAGPNTDAVYPTLNAETTINSVTVRDGICYVDLDASFLTASYTAAPETVIYSIVNSLAELSNINRVQILVGGDTTGRFMETMPLSTVYERNLDLLEQS